ncbi:MAG: hypothetical protein Q9219_006595 [cf. Caloplaca sp. 3 TL-2023]
MSVWGKGKLQLPWKLSGDVVPTVDVLIPCCGEPLAVVLDTVRAACVLNYPKNRYRIAVLDDGRSSEVKEEIRNMSKTFPDVQLHYSSRPAKSASHSRAGNLNHGLDYLTKVEGEPSELVAVLDIDMIPLPSWLRTVIPPLLNDTSVGLVNPRQKFYNLPDRDPMVQNLDMFFDGMETVKACLGISWCTGTGFVTRRTALEQIGGIPTEFHCDDLMTSVYLAALGWKIEYIPETVQLGLVPDTVRDCVKQSQRWLAGHMYNLSLLRNSRANGRATMRHRIQVTLPSIIQTFASFVVMASLITVPFLMLYGVRLIEYQSPHQLRILLVLESLQFFAEVYSGYLRSRSSDFTGHILSDWAQIVTIPFLVTTSLRVIFTSLISGTAAKFASPAARDRSPNSSIMPPSTFTRIKTTIASKIPDSILLVALSIFIPYAFIGLRTTYSLLTTPTTSIFDSLSHNLYPPLVIRCLKYLLQSYYALSCILRLSQWPSREDMLDRDPVTKVAYPSTRATNPKRLRPRQTFTVLCVFYYVFVGWVAFR